MKVAELYAQLGIKVDRHDLGMLKEFEHTLNGIASSARAAAAALRQLAQTPLSRGFGRLARAGAAPAGAAPAAAATNAAASPTPPPASQTSAAWWTQLQANQRLVNQLMAPIAGRPAASAAWWRQLQAGQRLVNQLMTPITAQQQQPGNPFLITLGNALGRGLMKTLGIATLAMAITNLIGAIKNMVTSSMAAAFNLDKFTMQTGMSREELKRWEYAASQSDVTVEELRETFKNLQQQAQQIRLTGQGATPFLQLGVNPMAPTAEVLKQFGERTRNMSMATAVWFGNQMKISEGVIYMLRKNADALGRISADTALTDQQVNNMGRLNSAWKDFTFTFEVLSQKFVADIAPALTVAISLLERLSTMKLSNTYWDFISRGLLGMPGGQIPGVALSSLLGARNPVGGASTTINNNTSIEMQGTGNSRADGKALGETFTQELKAYFQRTPTFVGTGLQ